MHLYRAKSGSESTSTCHTCGAVNESCLTCVQVVANVWRIEDLRQQEFAYINTTNVCNRHV